MIRDFNLSATYVIAAALWTVGACLIVASLFTINGLGHLGLLLAGAGGVLNIRGFFCRLGERERAAFELGRESMHSVR